MPREIPPTRPRPAAEAPEQRFERLLEALRRQHRLGAALHLLAWDQETFMPPGAAAERAEQIGTLTALLHGQRTDPAFLELVDTLASELERLPEGAAVDVRETKWRLDRERALDPALVRARSVLQAEARTVWVQARRAGDYAMLAPYLERLFALQREAAAAIGPGRDPYDVLLEDYEPGATRAGVRRILEELRDGLLPLVDRLRALIGERPGGAGALRGRFPLDEQRRLNRRLVAALGFDLDRGRLDESAHPFTATVGADVRLTTRYDEADLRCGLFASVHEAGHGLYEQGLDGHARGTPRGTACSMGVHESQSRLWENLVGRSEAFWRHWHPRVAEHFPEVGRRRLDEVLLAVNEARPSTVRVEADELTYNLHIVLRFELECRLLDGTLAFADLPDAWAELSRRYLGVEPRDHRDGVLQDVHWAGGDVGYFPTYALGNVYAAALWKAARRELGDVEERIARGDCAPLVQWLRDRIHRHGQAFAPEALIERATEEPPAVRPLLEHLEARLAWLEVGSDGTGAT